MGRRGFQGGLYRRQFMITIPTIIRPIDLWTEEEIKKNMEENRDNPNWIPKIMFFVINENGDFLPHPERPK